MSEESEHGCHDGVGPAGAAFERLTQRWVIADPERRREVARDLGRQVNDLARAWRDRGREGPTHAELRDLLEQIVAAVDFGLLRDAIESRAEDLEPLAAAVLGAVVSSPVRAANTITLLPALANALVRLAGKTLRELSMPPEVQASALFGLVGRLDAEAVAALVDALAALVVGLHEGSLVLGRDEPRWREVFTRLSEGVLDRVDGEKVARAAVAVAEDLATVAASLGDLAYRRPELPVQALRATMASARALAGGLADALGRLEQLPDEAMEQLAETIDAELEPAVAARLVDAASTLAERVLDRRPDLPERLATELGAAVDGERLVRLASKLLGPLVLAMLRPAAPALMRLARSTLETAWGRATALVPRRARSR
jgi:hypothetical protein